MASIEASWQEPGGATFNAPARMENRSPSGVCIRLSKKVTVGSRIRLRRRHEEILGILKYCCRDGLDYIAGIHRIDSGRPSSRFESGIDAKQQAGSQSPAHMNDRQEVQSSSEDARFKAQLTFVPSETNQNQASSQPQAKQILEPDANATPEIAGLQLEKENRRGEPVTIASPAAIPNDASTLKIEEGQARQPSNGKRWISMSTKWFKPLAAQSPYLLKNGKSATSNGSTESLASAPAETEKHRAGENGQPQSKLQGDLQSMADIYRAAGIMTPRLGYSITKVAEMMGSEHMREMKSDAKRAAILMALDAANISVDEVLRDAQRRQDALDAYEADQRKHFEEHWARKTEANDAIQAEIDRFAAEGRARMQRNLSEVTNEKVQFAEWQATKRAEAKRIGDAAVLCAKPADAEPAVQPPQLALSVTSSGGKDL